MVFKKLKIGLIVSLVALFAVALHGNSFGVDLTSRMAAAHRNDRPIATMLAQLEPDLPVTTQSVQYTTVDGEPVTGYFAEPEAATEPLPGIIAIHEWWGLNENIEAMARRLAGEGYQVLAVDLYNGQTADNSQQASQLMQSVRENQSVAKENLQQAYNYLAETENAPEIGVMGWCFGGGWALQTALMLPQKLDAAVIYYGELVTKPLQLASLQMPILGIFGAKDQVVPVARVREFGETLDSLGKKGQIYIYEEAGHAFANPSGDNYVPYAAADAWEKTTEFLAQYLAE